MKLWLIVAASISQALALSSCVPGYTSFSGTCLKAYKTPKSRDEASRICQQDSANLVVITDEATWNQVRFLVSGYPYSWIGMQCLGSNFDDCITDNGQRYSNDGSFFLPGNTAQPNPQFPNYYTTADQWQNNDGSLLAVFVCQISDAPGFSCDNGFSLLYGKCYKQANKGSQQEVQQYCVGQGSTLASVHSYGESLALAHLYGSGAMSYIGLSYQNSLIWLDGTPLNYMNIGTCPSSCTTPCYALINQDDSAQYVSGQWYPLEDCNSPTFSGICKKNVESLKSLSCPSSEFYGSGRIFSPGYPSTYPQTRCTYSIRAQIGQVIKIQFNRIYLDPKSIIFLSDDPSGNSYFASINGNSYNGTTYYSQSNYLRIVFDSLSSSPDAIFNNVWLADYQSTDRILTTEMPTTRSYFGSGCNSGYLYPTGTLTSPNYPANYYNNVNCTYQIYTGNWDQGIELIFTDFKTELSYDIVTVFDGPNGYSPIIAKLSGTLSTPKYLYSTSPYMTLMFTSDSSNVYTGFSASYYYHWLTTTQLEKTTTVSTTTSGRETTTSELWVTPTMNFAGSGCNAGYLYSYGTITSPNYPWNYYNNINCTYQIFSGDYSTVELVFTAFRTEANFDYVTIYDGQSSRSPMLARLSGFLSTPRYYYSTTPYMTVIFTSDGSTVYTGFSANYSPRYYATTEAFEASTPISTPSEITTDRGTNGWRQTTVGLTSIASSEGTRGTGEQTSVEGTTATSATETADWTTINPYISGCNAGYLYPSGTLTSPNYPNYYYSYYSCTYKIYTPYSNNRIRLEFTSFSTSSSDYVTIYDGSTTYSPVIAKLSGNYYTPRYYYSTSNYMTITFITQGYNYYSGFSANYVREYVAPTTNYEWTTKSQSTEQEQSSTAQATAEVTAITAGTTEVAMPTQQNDPSGCNSGYLHPYGTLTSPNYPGNYSNNLNCTYRIYSRYNDYSIQLIFNYFSTELNYDFVAIYDGPSANSPMIARLTGPKATPMYYYSSTSYMTLVFTTDSSKVDEGFFASYYTYYNPDSTRTYSEQTTSG